MDPSSQVPYSLAPGSQTVCYLHLSGPPVCPHLPVGTRSVAGGPATRSLAAG